MPEVQPYHAPYPNAVVGWTGTVWHCLFTDAAGRLQVRGEDQLFSFHGVLANNTTANPSGVNGYVESPAVPEGEIWVVTTAEGRDADRVLTEMRFATHHDGLSRHIGGEVKAYAAGERGYWGGHTYLDYQDVVRVWFIGCLAADNCNVQLTGYRMTVEV